jgi:hypothetical protein
MVNAVTIMLGVTYFVIINMQVLEQNYRSKSTKNRKIM